MNNIQIQKLKFTHVIKKKRLIMRPRVTSTGCLATLLCHFYSSDCCMHWQTYLHRQLRHTLAQISGYSELVLGTQQFSSSTSHSVSWEKYSHELQLFWSSAQVFIQKYLQNNVLFIWHSSSLLLERYVNTFTEKNGTRCQQNKKKILAVL
jgi:hypothetical protein